MGVTILKRKKFKRWVGRKWKVERIAQLNAKPVMKSVDVQAIKEEFRKKKAQQAQAK